MGSRYLVIEVDNQEQAGMLAEQIRGMTRKGKKLRLVGLFARPGKTCSCPPGVDRRYEVKRGERFGWWVCSNCGKPRLGNHELKNIMPVDDTIDARVDEGRSWLSYSTEDREYVQYPLTLSLVTYPKEVAQPDVA